LHIKDCLFATSAAQKMNKQESEEEKQDNTSLKKHMIVNPDFHSNNNLLLFHTKFHIKHKI